MTAGPQPGPVVTNMIEVTMIELRCTFPECTEVGRFPDGTMRDGMPLLDWFDKVGKTCIVHRNAKFPQWRPNDSKADEQQPKAHHRPGHDTEHAAAASIELPARSLRRQVLAVLREHPDGMTDDEGAAIIGGDRLRWGRRRNELCDAGLVTETDKRRTTPAGRKAIVWRAT